MSNSGDCRHCKDYRECKAPPDWFDYSQIRWCPYQCIWILAHSDILRVGEWPKAEDGSGDSNSGSRAVKTEASFVKPELIIAELEARLERCGTQAELLVTQVEDGRTLSNLSPGAREVLMYIKGFRRKRVGFKKWLREVHYGSKTGEKDQLVQIKP